MDKRTAFSDSDISEIGEIFYAIKTGGTMFFQNFGQAVDYVVTNKNREGTTSKK